MQPELWLLVLGTLLSSVSQVFLKLGADRDMPAATRWAAFRSQYLNWQVLFGYGLLALSMLLAIIALMKVDLKFVAVIEALSYAFVMVLSRAFLREQITWKKLVGNALIIAGVVVFGVSIF
jgi:drug/metabolite transporter (DMT)-like permease